VFVEAKTNIPSSLLQNCHCSEVNNRGVSREVIADIQVGIRCYYL
jgi:hypothetical protein